MGEAAPLKSGMRNIELKMTTVWDLYSAYIPLPILDDFVACQYSDKQQNLSLDHWLHWKTDWASSFKE